ncbi:unnamed protein product [Meloidogyne enterolobii]|uniref:Uncharacterized protein n=1 Tax=Meloidogyne enterolobii TaxID=390850 RepID=A0ACB0Z6G9_MELEN
MPIYSISFTPLLSFVLINYFISIVESLWVCFEQNLALKIYLKVPPDYWATVYRNGQLEFGRSVDELITFLPELNSYIGYWFRVLFIITSCLLRIESRLCLKISVIIIFLDMFKKSFLSIKSFFCRIEDNPNTKQRIEGYGHVSIVNTDPPRFCGNFASFNTNESKNICGGFRVLACKKSNNRKKNPLNDDNWIYGSSKLSEKVAIAVNPNNGKLIRFSFADKPLEYRENVKILECSNDFPVEDILSTSWPYPTFPPIYGGKKNNLIDIKRFPPKTTTFPAPTTILLTKQVTTTLIPPVVEQTTTTTIPTTIKPQQLSNKGEIQETDYIELTGAGINWGLDKEFVKREEGNENLFNNSITNKLWREDSNILTTNHQYHQHRRKRFKMKRRQEY